jgi:HPt (histidine-containing phosphotransfer) domain-containing protein
MTDAADKTAKLLATLWLRNRPIVEERLGLLDRAAEAASTGKLDEALREEGRSTAHKLSGSLGMYGFDEGTRVAREMEVLLSGASPGGERLRMLCAELRVAVFPAG